MATPRSMGVRGVRLALLALLMLLSGCGQPVTSLLVTVAFDDVHHHPTSLAVSVNEPAGRTVERTFGPPAGRSTILSGDNFAVLLPDELAGEQVTVTAVATGATSGDTVSGQGQEIAQLQLQVPMLIFLVP